ncbi:substrate-binding domain-containing protein [candidate division KSB1 bacterium]|nr:substrate-binding domain-containing protein [candidate division KSB1 bacterium]
MIKKQVTIKDIASRLNLHHTTVSKALRNHPDINPETKKRILETAESLDYHPNIMAQSFKNKKSNTVGVCVPIINLDFFAEVISGIQNVLYDAGYTMIVCQSNESYEREEIDTRALVSNQVAGLIIAISQTTQYAEHLKVFQRRGIPLVLFDRVPAGIEACNVIVDDFHSAFHAVQYLIKSGYRRIAHLAGPSHISVSANRLKGYKAALKKNNIDIEESLIIHGGFREEDGTSGFEQLIAAGNLPDAIFAVNDSVAAGAFLLIKKNGLKIPDDIALLGFGDLKISSYLEPSLTTVRQSPHRMGEIAAKMLIEQIEHKDEKFTPRTEIVKTELIIRHST